MPTVRGQREVKVHFASLRALTEDMLRGAARAGARVVQREAKRLSINDIVAKNIIVTEPEATGLIVVRITVRRKRWVTSLAHWQEWGTDPHFVQISAEDGGGRSAKRVNKLVGQNVLVIGGNFVAGTVWHPGARPNPFLRPALDNTEREAVAEMQGYINSRIVGGRITPASDDGQGDSE